VILLELLRALARPRRRERLILFSRTDRHRPPRSLRTPVLAGASTAVLRRELHLDHLVVAPVHCRAPGTALLPFRAGHPLLLPVHPEVPSREALARAGLPVIIRPCRPDQVHPIPPTALHEQLGIDVARVGQVLAR